MQPIAIIGGTGLGELENLVVKEQVSLKTPYGDPAHQLEIGEMAGCPVVFLARHGNPHRLAPHKVNYRANIWALKHLDVAGIIAVTAVGSIARTLAAADLVITDQIIDYSYGREHTFFDDDLDHIDFTYPNDETLRQALIDAAVKLRDQDAAFTFADQGVYGCTQGPRLETAAEIQRMARDGCDVVGMTAMPEAALARELGIPYAGVSMVVNKAAGIDGDVVTLADIGAVLQVAVQRVGLLLEQFLQSSQARNS